MFEGFVIVCLHMFITEREGKKREKARKEGKERKELSLFLMHENETAVRQSNVKMVNFVTDINIV